MMEISPWNINDRKINIALVGCGRISKNHFQAIDQHQDRLTLTSVCDNDPEALSAAVAQYRVDGYDTIDKLLITSNADIVALCTPSGLHSAQAIKIAKSGRHVLTEKPMATRWQDGLKMVKACDESGVR